MAKLRREYATDHFHDETFGDGLGLSAERSDLWGMTGPRDIT
jgi:hypothetical protein